MFIYESSSTSPYHVFAAAADLNGAFHAVVLGANGVSVAGAGTIPIGILSGETEPCAAGEDANVLLTGVGLWIVGEDVESGDLLAPAGGGVAVKAQEGDFIFARALESARAGEAPHVQIINAGVKG